MSKRYGYTGKILRVNLSSAKIGYENLPGEIMQRFVGGRGIGAKLLYDELGPGTDPLSPGNKLIFSTGPLAGTPAQSCSRWIVTTKSPQTGGIFRSCAGGGFGHEVKAAGFDILIVEGRATNPSYISIHDNTVEIRDAKQFQGLTCSETTAALSQAIGDEKIKTAVIGPAGEKMVRFASIADEHGRLSARGGGGTVMGSKNLKAIAVRGTGKVRVADRDALKRIVKEQVLAVKENPKFKGFAHMGTATGVGACHNLGIYPVKNFRDGVLENVENTLTVDQIEEIFVKDFRCHHCHIGCGRTLKVKTGPFAGGEVRGPEYEAMYSFGGNLCSTNLGMIVHANNICDEYGVDAITAGCTIAFAMECYEKGILSKKDLGGLNLAWGNDAEIVELLLKIINREGIGDLLAEGTRVAAEKIGQGADRYALHVKGLELPGYDPRALKASGLNLATTALGANHTLGQSPEEMMPAGTPGAVDRFSPEGKGAIVKRNQEIIAAFETGIMCIFPKSLGLVSLPKLGNMLQAATGIEAFGDEAYLQEVGERIWNLERAFNTREGFTRKDDYLPRRFAAESPLRGPAKGQVHEMDVMLDDYYAARGWSQDTGTPTRAKLESLDLKTVADELEKIGKLP